VWKGHVYKLQLLVKSPQPHSSFSIASLPVSLRREAFAEISLP